MVGGFEKSSFSNIEQQSLGFVKYTLEPWLMRWEQAWPAACFPTARSGEYFIRFNVEGPAAGDYASRMNGYAVARQNGWMSANDIRELENSTAVSPAEEGGDLYLVNGSMTKLSDAGALPELPQQIQQKRRNRQVNKFLELGAELRREPHPLP